MDVKENVGDVYEGKANFNFVHRKKTHQKNKNKKIFHKIYITKSTELKKLSPSAPNIEYFKPFLLSMIFTQLSTILTCRIRNQ